MSPSRLNNCRRIFDFFKGFFRGDFRVNGFLTAAARVGAGEGRRRAAEVLSPFPFRIAAYMIICENEIQSYLRKRAFTELCRVFKADCKVYMIKSSRRNRNRALVIKLNFKLVVVRTVCP